METETSSLDQLIAMSACQDCGAGPGTACDPCCQSLAAYLQSLED